MNHSSTNNQEPQVYSHKINKFNTIQPQNCSAVILAAGKGSRLGYCHKALLQVQGKTLLAHWLQKLFNFGIDDIVVVDLKQRLESTKKQIQKYTEKNSLKVLLVSEENSVDPIFTMIAGSKKASKQNIFFLSADTITTFPLAKLFFQQKSWGKFLLKHEINKGYLQLSGQEHPFYLTPVKNKEKLSFVYGGLCLIPKIHWQNETQTITPSKETLFKMIMEIIKIQNVQGIQIDNINEILHNINTQEDLERAQNLVLN